MRARPSRRLAGVVAGLCVVASASALVAGGPVAGAATPPIVTVDRQDAAPGESVTVTVAFIEACTTANAVLTNASTGNKVALSGFFEVGANTSGTSTITVPTDAWPGPYTVSAACLAPESPVSVPVGFTVTGVVPEAAIQISPTKGPPGTAIDVALAVTPPSACPPGTPDVGVAMRTQAQIDANAGGLEAAGFPPPNPSGARHGTLTVGNLPPDTALFVYGGCINPVLTSPYQTFIVTAADGALSAAQWKKSSRIFYDRGINGILLLLSSSARGLPSLIGGPTTLTTPTAVTTAPTSPPTAPRPPATAGTTTSTSTTTTTGGKP